MEIDYQINKEEFINFKLKNYKKNIEYMTMVFYEVLILLFIYLICYKVVQKTYLKREVYIIICIPIFILLKITLLRYYMKKEILLRYNLNQFEYLYEYTKLVLSDDSIKISTVFGEMEVKYKLIKYIYINGDYIYVEDRNSQLIYIPISAFMNVDDKKVFISELREMSSSKVLKIYPIK